MYESNWLKFVVRLLQLARKNREELNSLRKEEEKKNKVKQKQKQQIKALSFNPDDEEEVDDDDGRDEEAEIEPKKSEKKVQKLKTFYEKYYI